MNFSKSSLLKILGSLLIGLCVSSMTACDDDDDDNISDAGQAGQSGEEGNAGQGGNAGEGGNNGEGNTGGGTVVECNMTPGECTIAEQNSGTTACGTVQARVSVEGDDDCTFSEEAKALMALNGQDVEIFYLKESAVNDLYHCCAGKYDDEPDFNDGRGHCGSCSLDKEEMIPGAAVHAGTEEDPKVCYSWLYVQLKPCN